MKDSTKLCGHFVERQSDTELSSWIISWVVSTDRTKLCGHFLEDDSK